MGQALDLEAIKARCDAATPGPWRQVHQFVDRGDRGRVELARCLPSAEVSETNAVENAAFIAAARADVAALVAEVERLRLDLSAALGSIRAYIAAAERLEDGAKDFETAELSRGWEKMQAALAQASRE